MKNLPRIACFGSFLFLLVIVHCGGEPSKGRAARDGRILLLNETSRDMEVSYVHPDKGQIDTTVPPGEKMDVSQAVLKGGSEVTVRVEALTQPKTWANITVTIDGNVTIRITSLGAWGANELEYVIQ